jgi:hypothetical protein
LVVADCWVYCSYRYPGIFFDSRPGQTLGHDTSVNNKLIYAVAALCCIGLSALIGRVSARPQAVVFSTF